MSARHFRPVVLVMAFTLLLACSAETQSSLSGQVEDAVGGLGGDGAALLQQVEQIDANVRELADGLRRRVKRMEARLAALEEDVAKAAAEGERLQDAAASTAELAEQVQTLSAELERLEAGATTAGAVPATQTTCPVGETWNSVVQACAAP